LAISTGAVHAPLTCRDDQIPMSGAPSRLPPNQAATRPSFVSTIVDACALAKGAASKTNSDATIPCGGCPVCLAIPTVTSAATNMSSTVLTVCQPR
jgi:hypothetical protein